MVTDEITKSVQKVAGVKNVHLETPEVESHGDYATNIALRLAKKQGKNPKEVAEKIVAQLKKDKGLKRVVSKIEIAGPGFINFWLAQEELEKELNKVLKEKEKYGTSEKNKGKKVMFEYGQPNTHKLPHIGHLYSYIFGESMVRIMQATGWEVRRANYQSDVGPHVAKCLWAMQKKKPKIPVSLAEKVQLLQKMYQEGTQAYNEDEQVKKEIDAINLAIYGNKKSIQDLWKKTRKWNLDYYQEFEKLLGIKYDRYYFESEIGEKGKEIVRKNTPRVFKQSQGAYIFEGSKYGLHDRVFITQAETPTYEAKDMALQELKMAEWPADLLIISTGNEQNDYFKVVFKALELLRPEFKGKLKHIGFGMVHLKGIKMSSRTGQMISVPKLIEEIIQKVEKHNPDKKVSQIVGIGAIKYSFLKTNPLQDIKFDLQESISEQGNSGPYLQYTFARTYSLLQKAGEPKPTFQSQEKINDQEIAVLRVLPKFEEVVAEAGENYAPNLISNYLFDLASKFNTFYNQHRVVGNDFRLALSAAVGQILANGLHLLGIETLEKM